MPKPYAKRNARTVLPEPIAPHYGYLYCALAFLPPLVEVDLGNLRGDGYDSKSQGTLVGFYRSLAPALQRFRLRGELPLTAGQIVCVPQASLQALDLAGQALSGSLNCVRPPALRAANFSSTLLTGVVHTSWWAAPMEAP